MASRILIARFFRETRPWPFQEGELAIWLFRRTNPIPPSTLIAIFDKLAALIARLDFQPEAFNLAAGLGRVWGNIVERDLSRRSNERAVHLKIALYISVGVPRVDEQKVHVPSIQQILHGLKRRIGMRIGS
jgi:hypothetical protein